MALTSVGDFVTPVALETMGGEISPRRLSLLVAIGRTGSISSAAKEVGITYKAAWDAVDAVNNLAGEQLVTVQHGGRGGGGAALTQSGQQLVDDLQCLQSLQAAFMSRIKAAGDLEESLTLMRRLSVKSSARNVLSGVVQSVKKGGVNAEITVGLSGGDSLYAIVTCESVQELGLQPGREVQALIKASWVILADPREGMQTSARNRLCGHVSRVTVGEISAEVVLELAGGTTLAAVVTRESAEQMSVRTGDELCALIKASHVILGVSV